MGADENTMGERLRSIQCRKDIPVDESREREEKVIFILSFLGVSFRRRRIRRYRSQKLLKIEADFEFKPNIVYTPDNY